MLPLHYFRNNSVGMVGPGGGGGGGANAVGAVVEAGKSKLKVHAVWLAPGSGH